MSHLVPPFTQETAQAKVKAGQFNWNTRNPPLIATAYTKDCIWRNRYLFIRGRTEIIAFLTAKWERERNYTLRKELFCFADNKIAVQFWYEYQDAQDGMKWKRCYGLEDWTFDLDGRMRKRMMSGNDVLLGTNGDGVGREGEGVEGRWFVEGVDVEGVEISEKHF